MHIKRFEASSLAEAVERVKRELGPDALVLSTRSLRRDRGLFGLLSKPVVEVTAAVDRDARRAAPGEPAAAPEEVRPSEDRADADASWKQLRLSRALVEPLEAELRSLRSELAALAARGGADDDDRGNRDELRRLLRELAAERRGTAAAGPGCEPLLAAGLAPRHAAALAEAARQGPPAEREAGLREELVRRLEARTAVPRPDRDAPAALFVGAPGVGKTTSLAKLAARSDQRERGVELVTTDTFRIGAEEQLRTFADLLRAPFAAAVSPEDLARRARAGGRTPLLVDTAGRGRADARALGELCRYREALGERGRVHLVVSATTKEADLRGELRRFAPLRPDSLIVTRLDESDHLGDLANVVLDGETPPLVWVGTGQRVPEDLALAEPDRIASRLLGEAA